MKDGKERSIKIYHCKLINLDSIADEENEPILFRMLSRSRQETNIKSVDSKSSGNTIVNGDDTQTLVHNVTVNGIIYSNGTAQW